MASLTRWLALGTLLLGIAANAGGQVVTLESITGKPTIHGEASVSGDGIARLQLAPTAIRMRLAVMVKAPTMREAVQRMGERRDIANEQLATLGASKASVHWSPVGVGPAPSSQQQRQMQMVLRQRMAQGGRKPKEPPRSVTLHSTLTAEWPLKPADAEEQLIAVDELQEKIRRADLAGSKEMKKLTPEEQEEAEELAMQAVNYGMDEAAKPGEPAFVFFASISADQRASLLAEAFAKARSRADELATASGGKLGNVLNVSMQTPSTSWQSYSRAVYRYNEPGSEEPTGSADHEKEAVGTDPSGIDYQIHIVASFALKS
jgi:uncharacterized protein YggE